MYKIQDAQDIIQKSLIVIQDFKWLLDLDVMDFFADNHWNKIPISWQESMDSLSPQVLGELISDKRTTQILPLSMHSLFKFVETYSLPRSLKQNSINEHLYQEKHHKCFLKNVKLKKRHELCLMAEIIDNIKKKTLCNSVIDFGSGLGHLLRMLTYKFGFNAAGIESQAQLTVEARKLDLQFESNANKNLSINKIHNSVRPTHITATILSAEQIKDLSLNETLKEYGLVGLHPCGDLGPLLMQHFIKYDNVKFICVVGCCYMKLSCGKERKNYPMSNFVRNSKYHLSYSSREISCHAIEVYCDRLKKGQYEDLKVHAYRAAVEYILIAHDPRLKHSKIRSIKYTNNMTFDTYCSLALQPLNIPMPSKESPVWQETLSQLKNWRRVVCLYTLRLAIAPLVETVILLDRLLYLMENGIQCEIKPAFDPVISPRNHVIIGRR